MHFRVQNWLNKLGQVRTKVMLLRKRPQNPLIWQAKISGAKRTRTADPLHAMQVLYQLSYGPKYLIWKWLQSISSNITIILHHSSIPNLRLILLYYALLIFYGGVFIIYFITKTSQSSFWKNFANLPINFKGSFCFSWFQGLRH